MKRFCLLTVLFLGAALTLSAATPNDEDFIPRGTEIRVHTQGPITVAKWDRGRIYQAVIERDVVNRDGRVLIPRGVYCEMIVRQLAPQQLTLDLESITVNGRRYAMDAAGPEFNMDPDQYNNGGGIIGNILGAVSGNVEYQGDQIRVPAGTDLTFNLQQPLRIVNWRDEGYDRNGYHYHHEENHGWYR
jgi:hypothetical protein